MADENLSGGMDELFHVTSPIADTPLPTDKPAEQPGAATPQADSQPRQPDGKFAPKEPAPPVIAEPPPVDKPRIDPEQFKGYLDERDKRKAADARAERLERELAEARQSTQIPSVTDPEYAEYQARQFEQARISDRFDFSETIAAKDHTQPVVDAAKEWAMGQAQASPAFAAEYLKQKHPIDWAVKQHKRQAFLDEVGDDPAAYRARIIAEAQGAAPPSQAAPSAPAAVPQPVAPKPTPRPSLASAPTAGGMQLEPVVEPFEAIFPR